MLKSSKVRDLGFEGSVSILIFILIVGMLAFKARNDQWNVWKANPDLTFYNGSPLLSTADGPYFVGIAQSLSENRTVSSFNERRYFPNFNRELGVQKKLNDFSNNKDQQNDGQLNEMKSHFKKADKLGKIFLTLWCFSAVWFFYNLNA